MTSTSSPSTDRLVTAVLAGGSLVLGFAAAQLTGLRWAGAVVVLAGAAWCVLRERRRTPWWRLAVVVAVGAAAFVLSHVVADVVGPWVGVLAAGAVLGAVTWLLVRPGATPGPRPGVRAGRSRSSRAPAARP